MRISHYALFAVAMATFGYIAAAPGLAAPQEDGATAIPPGHALTPDQKAEHDGWPPDKRATYAAWPGETQAYYWTLTPERRLVFWALADSDKIALTAMAGPEREAAWERIEALAGEPPDAAYARTGGV